MDGFKIRGAGGKGLIEFLAVFLLLLRSKLCGYFYTFGQVHHNSGERLGDNEAIPSFFDAPIGAVTDTRGDYGQAADGGKFNDTGVALIDGTFGAIRGDAHAATVPELAQHIHEPGNPTASAGATHGPHAVIFGYRGEQGTILTGTGEHAHLHFFAFYNIPIHIARYKDSVMPKGNNALEAAHGFAIRIL